MNSHMVLCNLSSQLLYPHGSTQTGWFYTIHADAHPHFGEHKKLCIGYDGYLMVPMKVYQISDMQSKVLTQTLL